MSDLAESELAVKWKFGHQFLAVQPRICHSILRFEIIRLSCSSGVKPERQEIVVMVVTGLEMRSTSRAGDDKTPGKRGGISETPLISVHRLAPVTSTGASEWEWRTLGRAVGDCSQDFSFEQDDQDVVESFHRGTGDALALDDDFEAEDE
jgi:hypothetical protein